MSDVNIRRPEVRLSINRVGVTDVILPIFSMKIGGEESVLAIARVDTYIDLPKKYKGIHASRNYESITEIFSDYVGKKLKMEELCGEMAKDLLDRHPYANRSEVNMRTLLTFPNETPKSGKKSYERARLIGESIAQREEEEYRTKRTIGIEIGGISACPSAQKELKNVTKERLREVVESEEKIQAILKRIPQGTHMQRVFAKLMIDVPEGKQVDVVDLMSIVEQSLSSCSYELLKREDEVAVLLNTLSNPMFTEDIVRAMTRKTIEKFHDFPNETMISASIKSLESIHQHNMQAELSMSLGELKKRFKEQK